MSRTSQASRVSNRSLMSRTPSADRQLLRTLTVSPNNRSVANDDDDNTVNSPNDGPNGPKSSNEVTPVDITQPSKASYQRSRVMSQSPSVNGSPNVPESRTASRASLATIQLPPIQKEINGKDWQQGKTITQANEYMLKYEVMSDVTFVVGEGKEEFPAHKYILMSRSPVLFKSLVKHSGNPSLRIGVSDMKPDIFRELLVYLYTDEFDIHSGNVAEMLYASKKFQLKGLKNLCFQFLDSELDDESVCKIMEQAHLYEETVLFEKCKRHIFMNGNTVLRKQQFSELCQECVSLLLKSDELKAEEEAVFEACNTWANAQCRKQRIQPSDESRRKVLGKILYLIRFPVMDVTYFTQKVSLGQLLTHDETLSIFQYFHGEEQQLPSKFSRRERISAPRSVEENPQPILLTEGSRSKMTHVRRFPSIDGPWKQNGPPDAISFKVSLPIVLYGVEVYGTADGQETYECKLFVYDDISRSEIRKMESSLFTNSSKDRYELFLDRPVRVPARRVFTVQVSMKGSPTRKGTEGEQTIVAEGVKFEFSESSRSSNGTGVMIGQIPGLLFSKSQ